MTAPAPAPTPDRAPALWRNLSFHVLWFSTFASGVGDRLIMNAALPMLGYPIEPAEGEPEVASIQAAIQFFFFLPYMLWSPVAGFLADRLPRKWVMFTADQLRGLIVLWAVTLLPAGLTMVPEPQHWKVWLVILAVGVMAATFVPAKLSVVPNVVGLDLLPRANAAVVSMGVIGNLAGFIVGGLIVSHSLRAMVLVAALCYVGSGVLWIFLRTPWVKHPRGDLHRMEHPLRDITRGLRYAFSHRPVRNLILIAAVVWGGVAVYLPALGVVNIELYGRAAAGLMLVTAPVGLGMLIAAAALGLMNPRLGAEILIPLGLALCGLFIGLQMIVPSFALGVLIALCTGLGAGLLLVTLNTLLQRCTADHVRGRVFAAKEVIQEFGQVVISFVIWRAGAAADPAMRPAAGALALILLGMAVYGVLRFILRGPAPTRATNALWRAARLVAESMHRLRAVGRHHVPRHGPVLLVANHTSGLDPLLIQAAVPRLIHWMMAREYMVRPLGWLWRTLGVISVDRDDPEFHATRRAVDLLRDDQAVGVFPEGGIHRGHLGRLHPGFALIARRGHAAVVPVHISGTPDHRNPLLAYLIPSRSRVVFGQPFTLDPEQRDPEQHVERIRRQLQRLAETAHSMSGEAQGSAADRPGRATGEKKGET